MIEIRPEQYDLSKEGDVKRLAEQLSCMLTDFLVPFAAQTSEDLRGIFWGLVLAGPFGAMRRSIGPENAVAIHSLLCKVAASIEEERARAIH